MKTTLYDLSVQYNQLLDMMYDEEMDEETILDTIDAIEGEIEVKADGYAKVMKCLEMNTKAIDEEIQRLQAKKKTLENRNKWLKQRLFNSMKELGIPKIQTDLFTFSIQKNGGLQPLDVFGEVPDNFKKIIFENDNAKIREALKRGEELPFARFGERGESLRIR